MMGHYFSYSEGNGPFHVWGEGANPVPMTWNAKLQRPVYSTPTMPEFDGSVYTDRLWQWDSEKHDTLCRKHFGDEGQFWNGRDPDRISAFLSDYLDKPVGLVAVWQYNHAASGNPIWLMFYRHVEAAPAKAEQGGSE